jgi:hypothetical protein
MRGAVAFQRYLRSQDTIDIALGLFEAASSTVMVGRSCQYVIRIANVSEKVWDVKVTLQMSSMTAANVPARPSVRFTKRYTALPRRATEIECHYDWRRTVVFTIDKSTSPPDECWQREVNPPQLYVVSAILSDPTGKYLDRLDIYQELQG